MIGTITVATEAQMYNKPTETKTKVI